MNTVRTEALGWYVVTRDTPDGEITPVRGPFPTRDWAVRELAWTPSHGQLFVAERVPGAWAH